MREEALFPMPQTVRTSDDYWTPKWIFDALGLEFDLDVACPPEGPMHTPCKRFLTQADDGLATPWEGRVFMNPPFSRCSPWMHRWLDHRNGIAITVQSKSKWADRLWAEADGIVLLNQSMSFVQGRIPWPVIISAIGADNAAALQQSGLGRMR